MRDRLERILAALLPDSVLVDAFDPASRELRVLRAEEAAGARGRIGRVYRSQLHVLRLLVLFADCWRLVLRGVLSVPRIPADRPSRRTERLPMIGYYAHHAFTRLVREPAFTLAAVLTLALGVGANVAVFAVVEAVLLRPLPYEDPSSLVILNHRDTRTGITKEFIAIGDWVDIADRQISFDGMVSYGAFQASIYDDNAEPASVGALSVGPGLFEMMKVKPAAGRGIEEADTREGAAPVMVLGHALWRERYGSDPDVVGRGIRVGQQVRTVVGVAPPGFRFPPTADTDVILPAQLPLTAPAGRKSGWTFGVGRLAAGQTVASATSNLASISQQMEAENPEQNQGSTYYAVSLRDSLVGNTRQALVLMLAAVVLVLLIACANVANLQLARSLARRREIAVRLALGAGRGRLATLLLSENLALALVAGVLGIGFAHWGVRALVALVPQAVQVPGLSDVRLNPSVLAFALLITIGTALAFGYIASLTVRLEQAADVLVSAGRASMSRLARRATSSLVAIEIALAIVLLIGAGLVLRTFTSLLGVDPGFEYDGVMTMTVQLPPERYATVDARAAFWTRAFDGLNTTPGVTEAGVAVVTPLTGNNWTVPFERADRPVPAGERPPDVGWQVASGGFFRAMQIPLRDGRLFDERDRPEGNAVVIISESIAKLYFPDGNPVGVQVRLGRNTALIVGVVGDIRRAGLTDQPRADMYFPFEANPSGQITAFVRTSGDPVRNAAAIRAAFRSIEPAAVFLNEQPMTDVVSESVRTTQLLLWLLGVFASCALLLAAVGIYGVMSYTVRQRTREIGTRMAVGATRGSILWLVLRQGSVVAAIGIGAGLVAGLLATRSLRSVLFGVSATDPVTLALATTVIAATTLVACYIPARRASAIDPARTLAQQ